MWAYPNMVDEEQLPALRALFQNDGKRLLRKNMIKVYADGLLDSTTAAVLSQYKIDLHLGIPGNRGKLKK